MTGRHVDTTRTEDDGLTVVCLLDCDRPYDQHEGRFCGTCGDHVSTCGNDHCLECGEST